jgi:hypothetical protein
MTGEAKDPRQSQSICRSYLLRAGYGGVPVRNWFHLIILGIKIGDPKMLVPFVDRIEKTSNRNNREKH